MHRTDISYFLGAAGKLAKGSGRSCPNCGSRDAETVDRKYLVTYLARCRSCKLQFRAPTTTDDEFHRYYQRKYTQGFTTELPSIDDLAELKSRQFKGTERDYSSYIAVLRALGFHTGDRLLDFGCSWGYGSWQFRQAGFDVKSLEVSQHRASFAREKLGLEVFGDWRSIRGTFDVFFSAHVLEHIPKFSEVLALARRVVRRGGLFVAATPNGSTAYRETDPEGWHRSWGFVHPLLLDEEFYKATFRGGSYVIDTTPYDHQTIRTWAESSGERLTVKNSGNELIVAARL